MRAFVTRWIPEAALRLIHAACEVDLWPNEQPPSPQELKDHVAEADGLLCLLTDRIDSALLEFAPRLRVISQMAVGVDNIDVPECTHRSIPVGNTPGVLTQTTADLAFALILSACRRIVEADHYTRSGEWTTWSPMLMTGRDVHHAVLGIVGMGRIGGEVARRASGFEMKVLYCNRSRDPIAEARYGAVYRPLNDLLQESDIVSLHTPLTPETRHLIGREQLSLMKRHAVIINTARGPIIDEQALYHALKGGEIGGAGLDVFEEEPLSLSSPLLSLRNVVALPHIGSASIETRTRMAVMAAENLVAGLMGQRLPHVVNPEVYGVRTVGHDT